MCKILKTVGDSGVFCGTLLKRKDGPTVLKKLIALATVKRDFAKPGSRLEMEVTVEAVRHRVLATAVKTPFFNPKRKMAVHAT